MSNSFYDEMKSKLQAVLKMVSPVTIKVDSNVSSDDDTIYSGKAAIDTVNTADVTEEYSSKCIEPLEVTIHNPTYEYVHGKKFKSAPTWIVIHYTACINVGAKAMCKAMHSNTSASSHFYVDENDICSAVPLRYVAWHVGNGQCRQPSMNKTLSLEELSKYKSKDWRYDLSAKSHIKWKSNGEDFKGNSYSIGVDMCVKKKNKSSRNVTDTDWYFDEYTIENTVKLVAYLAKEYSISMDHIITHCMATGKLCPQPFTYPAETGDNKWDKFLDKVAECMEHEIKVKWVY